MKEMKRIYMDTAATTKVRPEVLEKMEEYCVKDYGNPSSVHLEGVNATEGLARAREILARSINATPEEIYFTSGGSESDNWALEIGASQTKGKHIIVSSIEHKAILKKCIQLEKRGYDISYIGVDEYGIVKVNELARAIRPDTALISVMTANNEIGTIQPIYQIGKLARERNVLFHTDAVCAYTKMPIDVVRNNIDMLSAAAHKIEGPKGVGLLYVRKNVKMNSMIFGGSQEYGRRGGTENVAGIAGFAKAWEIKEQDYAKRMSKLRRIQEYFIMRVMNRIPKVRLNGSKKLRIPMNVNFCFMDIEGTTLTLLLDADGISCSSGSACNQGVGLPSHVIMALGATESMANSSVRFTFDENTTFDEIDYVVDSLDKNVTMLRDGIGFNGYQEGKN